MKNKLIILSLLIVIISVFAYGVAKKKQVAEIDNLAITIESPTTNENLRNASLLYTVKSVYSRSVTKTKLQKSKLLSDFIEGYPVNWISAYISVEISNEGDDGIKTSLLSKSDVLNDEQRDMLIASDIDTRIVVKVKYNTKNMITHELEESEMNVSLIVIPEVEAEYSDGYEKLISYLKENSADKMTIISNKQIQSTIRFSINKTGSADNVKLIKTSGNTEIDNLLIELIVNMPKWNPAKNLKSESVTQQFDFTIGSINGC